MKQLFLLLLMYPCLAHNIQGQESDGKGIHNAGSSF